MASERLKEAIHKFRKASQLPALDLAPTNTFEALLDERIKALEKALGEVKGRINGLLLTVVGAVIVEVVLKLVR